MNINLLLLLVSLYHINCKLPFFNILSEKDPLFQEKNITYIYGHKNPDTDSISSAIILADLLSQKYPDKVFIPGRLGDLNKETKYALELFNFSEPIKIDDPSGADQIILVDHNSPAQSLDFDKANIVGLIDHHAITGFYTNDPITIITKPVGSTSTILYELYKSNNIKIPKKIAGLIISAIISDTLLLKSPITTEEDRDAVTNLADYADVIIENYGFDLLKRGCDVTDLTEEEIINLDSKFYKVNGYKIQIAFLNSVEVSDFLKTRKNQVLKAINNFVETNKMQLFILVIVDIMDMDSTCLIGGQYVESVEKAFNVTVVENEVFLKGIASRKKQVYPKLAEYFEEMPEYKETNTNNKEIIKINWLLLICVLIYIIN